MIQPIRCLQRTVVPLLTAESTSFGRAFRSREFAKGFSERIGGGVVHLRQNLTRQTRTAHGVHVVTELGVTLTAWSIAVTKAVVVGCTLGGEFTDGSQRIGQPTGNLRRTAAIAVGVKVPTVVGIVFEIEGAKDQVATRIVIPLDGRRRHTGKAISVGKNLTVDIWMITPEPVRPTAIVVQRYATVLIGQTTMARPHRVVGRKRVPVPALDARHTYRDVFHGETYVHVERTVNQSHNRKQDEQVLHVVVEERVLWETTSCGRSSYSNTLQSKMSLTFKRQHAGFEGSCGCCC